MGKPIKPNGIIEKMYFDFLKKVGLKESSMPEVQKVAMKQAFFAGVSSYHIMLVHGMPESEKEQENILGSIESEISEFWNNQVAKHEPKNNLKN